ncbi:glycosyltransferase 87 family protein [Streptomyces toxytricini]|uniref:Glycosyltransferase 87 family protein n=1 Tax=Streptomyces toxytricini TaxID=67369 RepID=A0ABW8EMF3_STRT5
MTPRAPSRPAPALLAGVLVTAPLLALGVLCVLLRVPAADSLVAGLADGLSAAEWRPPAAYPPFAAIMFTPAAWLPTGILKAVFVLGNAGLLALLVLLSCRLTGLRPGPAGVLAATTAGLWVEPLFQSLLPGQVNLALACLVLWDLGRPGGALGKGFGVGTAAGITLAPAVFVPYLLLTGRVRAGLTALAAFAGTALLGLLVLPEESAAFWARLAAAGPNLLPYWPHLWVWAVPALAYAARAALPAAAAPRRAVPRPAGEAEPVGAARPTGPVGRAGVSRPTCRGQRWGQPAG